MKVYIYYLLLLFLLITGCEPERATEKNIDAWYKHLLIYNLDVKTFQDSDGNGEGDFKGLTSRLPYLKSLGVNTIWLAPFQPSPLKDDGYDITDYYGIDSKLGSKADFDGFMKSAKNIHIKVVMDIVLNHSSIEHVWFRSKPNWYVWSNQQPKDWDEGMGFPEVEKETWRKDTVRNAWYFHRFYNFQPDLNYQNREVVAEAKRILAYWSDQGMDGFRLDAVPFTIDDPRENSANPKFDFNLLHELTGFVEQHKPGTVLLGEANVDPQDNEKYFAGHHYGLQMMFNFYANQYLFYALATGDASELKKALNETKAKPGIAQWAWFLRNHDEVDLGRLSKMQYKLVCDIMGPDSSMQLYGRGIRRRLAPMLNNNSAKIKLAYSLLYSLPGTPVIRQGEEIGMGDDLNLKERLSVRTPMQWDSTVNSGFTKGHPFRPIISTGTYNYRTINVEQEKVDKTSLLNYIESLIRFRKNYPEITNGAWKVVDSPKEVLAMEYVENGRRILITHNFSGESINLNLAGRKISLAPFDHNWLRI